MTTPESPALDPDDKDWTWVLEQECPECGFDAGSVDAATVAGLLRDNARQWAEILTDPDLRLRERPDPASWSALEYGAHVRDVNFLYLERLDLMLTEHGPSFADWDQDETAVTARYHEADPDAVATDLLAGAGALADRFDAVEGDQWDRTGYRSDGADFTVDTFARYFIHDPIHHLHDVRGGFAQLSE